jgi:hypothetical protein
MTTFIKHAIFLFPLSVFYVFIDIDDGKGRGEAL